MLKQTTIWIAFHLGSYHCVQTSSVEVVLGVVKGPHVSETISVTHVSTVLLLGAFPLTVRTGAVGGQGQTLYNYYSGFLLLLETLSIGVLFLI